MSTDIHQYRILILDFGSQYTQLIARRVREIGVYSEIYPWDVDAEAIRAFGATGIILSGGPESVTAPDSPRAADVVFELDVPVLGICYGMQTMAVQMGGAVQGADTSEFGYAQIRRTQDGGLLHDIVDHVDEQGRSLLDVWM
ncbi:MAG: gamma-glutamyl-gamma-aminobutyrate hydrolase family protein, partial [Halieaceae bacterium]|nr:gamma-glutamyl-gamma-aminobutyrate hydrolase family protein [Halieaceae bacterium]